jgi:NAD(P)-dependent dehydrogenase (short-subunit alcohol dehydrogenase family)
MAGLPMKRAALPEEVSGLVAFLCSDHASYISGSAVTIDGGLLSDSAIGVKRG